MVHVSRRKLLQLAAVAPSALPLTWTSVVSAATGKKTLNAVMQSDLRVTDPGFTTAIITRDHGYMVYDTLLGIDGWSICAIKGMPTSLATSSAMSSGTIPDVPEECSPRVP
ncbi:hypothetical protein ABIF65_009556 [Bradyrhizobium japonicum]